MKTLVVLVSVLFVVGCGKQEAKEYQIRELVSVCDSIDERAAEDLERMSYEEIYGTSEDSDQEEIHYFTISNKVKDKYLSDYNIRKNQKVKIMGRLSYIEEVEGGNIFFRVSQQRENGNVYYSGLSCMTSDRSILDYNLDTYVTVEGVFYKSDRREECVSDCILINNEQ